jgi:hypothetical protein
MAKRRNKKKRHRNKGFGEAMQGNASVQPAPALRRVPDFVPDFVPVSVPVDPVRQRAEDVRAAIAELRGDRTRIIGVVGVKAAIGRPEASRKLPEVWTFPHVHERLREAMGTLDRMPADRARPRQFGNAMPQVVHDFADIRGWYEDDHRIREFAVTRNRVRLAATPAQISRMMDAFGWLAYLDGKPELARAVGFAATWSARGLKFDRMVKTVGLSARVHHARWIFGLRLIADALNRDRVGVS